MEKDFEIVNHYRKYIEESLKNKNVYTGMFLFGYLLGTQDSPLQRKLSELGPFLKELIDEYWQIEELRQVQNGWDNILESPNIPYGILFLVNQLTYVIKCEKSEWAYYYLLGNALGLLNSDEIKSSEFQYFINKVPTELIEIHSENFVKLINIFLLKDIELKYNNIDQYFYYASR